MNTKFPLNTFNRTLGTVLMLAVLHAGIAIARGADTADSHSPARGARPGTPAYAPLQEHYELPKLFPTIDKIRSEPVHAGNWMSFAIDKQHVYLLHQGEHDSISVVSRGTSKETAHFDLGSSGAAAIAMKDGDLWVMNRSHRAFLRRLDLAGKDLAKINVESLPAGKAYALALDGNKALVSFSEDGNSAIYECDLTTHAFKQFMTLPEKVCAMTVHQGLLWIVQQDSDSFGHYWLHVVDMGSFAGRKLRFLHQDVWGLGSDGAQMYSMARESKGFVAEVSPFAPIPEQGIVLGNPLRQEFVLTYTFVKKSGGTYNLDAYTPYPSDMPFQHVFDIKVSPAPTETLVDTFGNRWMHFKLRAQNKSAAITLRFGIETMAAAFTLRTSKDAKGLDQAAEQLYTKATSAFDYRDPAFAKVTMAHTGADAVARITDIHDFVNDALRVVGPSGPETSASEFLTKGIGRCYAHTLVFAAIARRDGLATRAVGGIALKAVDVPAADPAVHTWDQVYLPGSGWMDVDVVADQTESGKPARHEMIGYHRNACFLTFQGNYDKFNGKDLFAERNWYMHRTYESVDKKNPVELTGGQITSQVSDLVLAKP